MTRLAVMCLPDLIFALPYDYDSRTESVIIPTRSINRGAKQPMWVFLTSEELETDSEDYNRLKEVLSGFSEIEDGILPSDGDEGYLNRLQVVITAAFRNLEADPNFNKNNN